MSNGDFQKKGPLEWVYGLNLAFANKVTLGLCFNFRSGFDGARVVGLWALVGSWLLR